MSREEWWDQEITSMVIVLTISHDTMPWLSPGSWISRDVAECHALLRHLLPEHLYNLSVVTEHQADVNYYRISQWLIRALSHESTLQHANNNSYALSYWFD